MIQIDQRDEVAVEHSTCYCAAVGPDHQTELCCLPTLLLSGCGAWKGS
jgi:hypothetical protein